MALYDHFYAPNPRALDGPYDFITATEVVEHLHHPRMELARLWTILEPGGILGIMTKLMPEHKLFAQWHYKRDPTHVCFFSRKTFEWLAIQWHATLTCIENDVMLLEKKATKKHISL